MTDSCHTILIVGATSGIGEELARQYHAKGKQVIISGRRLEKLTALTSELPGLWSIQLDIQDLDSAPQKIGEVFKKYPSLDTVIINAGIQKYFQFSDSTSKKGYPASDAISAEINTNLTGPIVFSRCIVERFLSLHGDKPSTIAFVTSALGFIPVPIFPVYNATKSALHYFAVSLRLQLKDTPISVVEIVPPYVNTALDEGHRDVVAELFGGDVKGVLVGPYVESIIKGMEEKGPDGKTQKIVAEGMPRKATDAWVNAYGEMAKIFGVEL